MSARTALVFPGQGSQRLGMFESVPENDALGRLLDAAEALSDLDLRAIVADGPESALSDTRVAQPLLYLADWAWGSALIDSGLRPTAVAGHSLGELAALAVAGVFSVEAGLELVVERSKLMATTASATPGSMIAVLGLDREQIVSSLAAVDGAWLANDNSPGQMVISGTPSGIAEAGAAMTAAGARRVVELKVSGPFHSPLMEPARSAFEELIAGADFSDAAIPVYQNTDPTPALSAEAIRSRLIGQITAPVRWTEIMLALAAEGPVTLVEAGPGAVLTGLAKRMENITAVSAESAGIEAVIEEVA